MRLIFWSGSKKRSPLANPSILSIEFENSTGLVLRVTAIARARCYGVNDILISP